MLKRLEGGITVFLSLVILLILALIGTVIESARVNVAKVYADRSLLTAMDSEFSKYQEDLYEDYHLFLMEKDLSIDTMEGEEFLDSIQEYLMYSFQPNVNLNIPGTNYNISNMNLLNIETEGVSLVDFTVATDYKGELFLNEVTEYMKYKTGAEVAETFLEKMKLLQKSKKTVSVVKEKLQMEKKLGEIDQQVMDLMEHVEGITFNKSGIKFTKGGLIKAQNNFAKKFCAETINNDAVGVKHAVVWNSLKKEYINPFTNLNKIDEAVKKILKNQEDTDELKLGIDKIKDIIQQFELDKINRSKKKKKVKYTEEEIEEFKKQIDELEKTYNDKKKGDKKDSEDELKKISQWSNEVINQSDGIVNEIEEALKIIPKMSQKRSNLKSSVGEFGKTLEGSKGEIDAGVYDGLIEDFTKIKKYIGSDSEEMDESTIARLIKMEPILESNKVILQKIITLGDITKNMSLDNLVDIQKKVNEIKISLNNYSLRKLAFDYSQLVINPEQKNPFSLFGDLIQDGMLGLVVDDVKTISKSKVIHNGLPSELMIETQEEKAISKTKDNEADKLVEYLNEGADIGYDADLAGSLGSYEVLCEDANIYSKTANGVVNNILLNEYAIEHFKSYTNETTNKIALATGLEYEQEYILCGKESDYKNIQGVVLKTIFIRTVLNYLYLISDSSKSSLAHTTALGLVGFTCLEPLVSTTKHLILITWAFEESLIDTHAILDGKEIPFFKDKSCFALEYNEMLLVNKKMIDDKADKLENKPKSTICFGYDDYMRVYLLLTGKEKKCYRTMDLMQGNMQLRYSKEFQMSQCVFGARVKVEYLVPIKFIKLPFVNSILDYEGDGFRFELERDYSY